MHDVLLINPPSLVFETEPVYNVPLGLLCIGTYLEKHGYSVQIIDCKAEVDSLRKIEQAAAKTRLYAGVSALTADVKNCLRICESVRRANPGLRIVWGGIHPTIYPEMTARDPLVDYAVVGEGEGPALDLARAFDGGRPTEDILDIGYMDRWGKMVRTGKRGFLNMDDLPELNYHLLGDFALAQLRKHGGAIIHAGRGCNFRCTFCIDPNTDNGWRGKSAEKLLAEIEKVCEKYGATHFYTQDDNFFSDLDRVERFMDGLLERNLGIQWRPSARSNIFKNKRLTDEFLRKLKAAGACTIASGAESGSPRILKLLKKGLTVQHIQLMNRRLREVDIRPSFSFMTAIPGETKEDQKMTIDLIKQLVKENPRADIVGPQFYRPIPPGELYEEAIRLGWHEPKTLRDWAEQQTTMIGEVSPRLFPWVEDPLYAEYIWPMTTVAIRPWKKILGKRKGGRYPKPLVVGYAAIVKLRFRYNNFDYLYEQLLFRAISNLIGKLLKWRRRFIVRSENLYSRWAKYYVKEDAADACP